EKALVLLPRDSETKVVLGSALARTGQAERAAKLLGEMGNRFSREANYQAELANARMRAGAFADAEEPARQAVKLAPNAAATHGVLALVLMGLQRTNEAIDELRVATELEPQSAAAWGTLASAYSMAGQFKSALEACETGLGISPDHPLLQAARAQ